MGAASQFPLNMEGRLDAAIARSYTVRDMSESQHEPDSAPYSRPPQRSSSPTSSKTQSVIVAGTVGLAGLLALAGFLVYRSTTLPATPIESELSASTPASAPASTPAPAPASASVPAPAADSTDPKSRLKRCRPYSGFVADQQSPAVSNETLVEEAACLCSLARGFMVHTPTKGIQQYRIFTACPAGSNPVPLEPDAKVWLGQWIDEPGHNACLCSTDPRTIKSLAYHAPP